MKKIVIIGASTYATSVLKCVQQEGKYSVVGFIDTTFSGKGEKHQGYPILGTLKDLPLLKEKHQLLGGIVAIESNKKRKIMTDKIAKMTPDFDFVVTIDPSVELGDDLYIGKGTVVLEDARVEANSWVGDFCILNSKTTLGNNGIMDDFSSLATGVLTGSDVGLGKFTHMKSSVTKTPANSPETSFSVKDLGYHAIGFGKRLKINL